MEMTLGSMFFYGGIAGLAVTVLTAIIAGITLGSGKRSLKRKLYEEYGMNSSIQQPPSNVNINKSYPAKRTRNLKKLVSGIVTSVLTLSIAVVVISNINSRPATADEMLSLGERYLLELQFEQALVQFLAVIEIEPMNVRAYLGAAEAFIGLGQQEDAINILRLGYERTGSELIRQKLEELEGVTERINVSVGDIIQFGPYDWRVLDVQGDTALIITDRVIAQRAFHEISGVDVT